MKHSDESHGRPVETHPEAADIGRRRFVQGSVASAAGALLSQRLGAAETGASKAQASLPGSKRPNFLILMCDENRFPPVYESPEVKRYRNTLLGAQNLLRRNGVEFMRHYAASVACSPSRASIYTGHYPSLHGTTQTTGAAKEAFDPDVFWLDPNSVPTLGDYFRAAGYATYWRGKWHASDADMLIPGTHSQLVSYDASGVPDPTKEALYTAADRLDRYGFTGWIGPEPHGKSPLNSGSSVPPGQQGRDVGFAQQVKTLIEQLDHDNRSAPWLIVASFVNPHDITLWGLWAHTQDLGFDFTIQPYVPEVLFDSALFNQTQNDDLAHKPAAQASYQATYQEWMQPILDDPVTLHQYFRYYYQLLKNVDDQMMTVLSALLASRYRDDTIVIFTSDHGELLGSHYGMHQKWYTAYDEALRVPLIVSNSKLFPAARSVDSLTSHVDLLPTLLGLAGIEPEPIRQQLAQSHSDALPLVGRDLSALVLGTVAPASVAAPIYFMTDDDPSRGLNQDNWTGIGYNSVVQPNHLETVITRLADGKVWKYTRYFDNPQFWSEPGTPSSSSTDVQDVVFEQTQQTPPATPYPGPDVGPQSIGYSVTVKSTPHKEQFEMYNVTDDPMELSNLHDKVGYAAQQAVLAQLLAQQRCAKRLTPQSGTVPGQPASC